MKNILIMHQEYDRDGLFYSDIARDVIKSVMTQKKAKYYRIQIDAIYEDEPVNGPCMGVGV